jgi:hypothetical protein
MSDAAAHQAVAAILARDDVRLTPDEHARLIDVFAELQPQLAALRIQEVRHREPAMIYPAANE